MPWTKVALVALEGLIYLELSSQGCKHYPKYSSENSVKLGLLGASENGRNRVMENNFLLKISQQGNSLFLP